MVVADIVSMKKSYMKPICWHNAHMSRRLGNSRWRRMGGEEGLPDAWDRQ